MVVTGVIAEYNPFHYGHAFHLAQARRITGASHVIVVMSGNYVQRGVPAMFDKYTRAQAALHNGADLVLEPAAQNILQKGPSGFLPEPESSQTCALEVNAGTLQFWNVLPESFRKNRKHTGRF